MSDLMKKHKYEVSRFPPREITTFSQKMNAKNNNFFFLLA